MFSRVVFRFCAGVLGNFCGQPWNVWGIFRVLPWCLGGFWKSTPGVWIGIRNLPERLGEYSRSTRGAWVSIGDLAVAPGVKDELNLTGLSESDRYSFAVGFGVEYLHSVVYVKSKFTSVYRLVLHIL